MKKIALIIPLFLLIACGADDSSPGLSLGSGDGVTGVGGSTARFAIRGNYMYVSTKEKLKVLDLNDGRNPQNVKTIPTFGGLETAITYENHLFLGAENGVYIYNLDDPETPEFVTLYTHQTGCDPVIVNGDFAYLTIRDEVTCTGHFVNQLLTIDISDITNPQTLDTVEMIRPRGLTIYNGDLYVGEGVLGLKKFNINTPWQPKLDTFFTTIPANDMIGLPNQMIITANNGVSQYISQADSLNLLSTIN